MTEHLLRLLVKIKKSLNLNWARRRRRESTAMSVSAQIASTVLNTRAAAAGPTSPIISSAPSSRNGDALRRPQEKNESEEDAGWRRNQNPNILVYEKMEKIVSQMQCETDGIPIRTVKSFMSKIPSVFTGQDIIAWITTHFRLMRNDSSTYYRFQTPYYWPSKSWSPENTDYAVYLCKRTMQNKTRLELADYEAENLTRLQKMFSRKWEYIFMQAEAQSKVDKKRDKQERKILDTQERAFWDVYRPPPGSVNTTDLDIKKVWRMNKYNHNPETKKVQNKPEDLKAVEKRLRVEASHLRSRVEKCTIRITKCAETYAEHFNLFHDYDYFLVIPEHSNPWISDTTDFWDSVVITEKRVRSWSFSCWDLLKDPQGHDHFLAFLEKEYATENLLFVEAVWKMKKLSQKDIADECRRIWHQLNMESPDRWTFDVAAAAHLYYLMTSDSYSRYLRSSHYKDFLDNTKKKNSRTFQLPKLSSAKLNLVSSCNSTATT
ncbi:RGS [Lepeophtheirus salmonis]|uniref:RGS n=1 Tax=Lepeophtheirus salmonis TaxID=72036 RepID=A0A7R8D8D2_LEPSM|nr:RGS [Lepeophtheirus salmonis]CAF3007602.1 RGS [Lepeophtheirus salmonis]